MKKIFLSLLLTILSNLAYSQFLLDMNEDQVRKEAIRMSDYKDLKFKPFSNDKYFTLTWEDPDLKCEIIVFFNLHTNMSVITSWVPNDQEVFKAIAKGFNEQYIRKSSRNWTAHYESKTIDISVTWADMLSKYVISFKEIKPEDDN